MASELELTPELLNSTTQIMKEVLSDCINFRRQPLHYPILVTFKIRAWLRKLDEHFATLKGYRLPASLELQLIVLQDFLKETNLHPVLRKKQPPEF